jgi:putative nucleotidyltransferase with HDIG domain
MSRRELVVVTDGVPRSGLPTDVAGVAITTVDWNDIRRLASLGDRAVLIDLDLRNISKVKTVKDNLPSRALDQCRIVAIDRSSHLAEVQAYSLGATDLLKRPFDIHELSLVLHRHFGQETVREQLTPESTEENQPGGSSISAAAAALQGLFARLSAGGTLQVTEITKAGDQIIDAIAEIGLAQWLDTVRHYHEGTFQHCLLVTGVATAFGQHHGMRRSDVSILTLASLLHDVGKAKIPLEILDKPGALTNDEFAVMKSHPVIGHDYLVTQNAIPRDVLDAVRHHHEYLDGSGYPDGLQGDDIKDLTRVLTVCDVYGALMERRAYKQPKSAQQAMKALINMVDEGKVEAELVRALGASVSADD